MDLCYAIRCTVCLATYPIGFQRQLYKECFVFQIPLSSFFLRSSSSCWRLFPPILIPYILPPIFPSTTRLRIQLLHKMWPIELAVLCFIAFWILTSLDCAVLFRYVWNKKKILSSWLNIGFGRNVYHDVNTSQIYAKDVYFRCICWQMHQEVRCERGKWYLGKDVEVGKLCVRACMYVCIIC